MLDSRKFALAAAAALSAVFALAPLAATAQNRQFSLAYDQPHTSAYGYGADVFAKKFDVLVDFLLLTSSGRLRGRGLCRGLGAGLRRRQEKGTGKKKCEDEFQFHGSSPLEFCEWSPAGGAGRRNQHFRK